MCRQWIDWDEHYRREQDEAASRERARKKLHDEVQRVWGPTARSRMVYYPMEAGYSACAFVPCGQWDERYVSLSDTYEGTVERAVEAALKKIKELEPYVLP